MKNKSLGLMAYLLLSSQAGAHGEDTPGPHGGQIRMPGNFHTEVTVERTGHFRIYLLDMKFQKPTVKNSSVEAVIKSGESVTALECKAKLRNYFSCTAPAGSQGALVIKATRDGSQGSMDAVYKLPLGK